MLVRFGHGGTEETMRGISGTRAGSYYLYDQSRSGHSNSIQSDQLAGHHYLRSCGLTSYCTNENARTALTTVYTHNCLKVENGYVVARRGNLVSIVGGA
jgi:uncharacterized protein (DUF608 family)